MPETRPYRLSLAPELESFRSEIEFSCSFLDQCHFIRRMDDAEAVLHYGPAAPANSIAVPNVVFPGCVTIDDAGIHPDAKALDAAAGPEGGGRLFPAKGGPVDPSKGDLAFDALGLIFLMLARLEERNNAASANERYGRFPYDAALTSRHDVSDPVPADAAAFALASALTGDPTPPSRTTFEVIPTHDVDRFRAYHRPFDPLRPILGDLVKRASPAAAWQRLRANYFRDEPWTSARRIMDLSENRGFASRFFFMGPTNHSQDSPYAILWPKALRQVAIEIIGRGHQIGFHPGFGTESDAALWNRQKTGLEKAIGFDVGQGRQHVLMFEAADTFDIWNDAGMDADFTLGFPECSGFRSGTCRPHPTYSLARRETLNLVAYPTAIMDFGFFGGKYRDLGVEEALDEAQTVIDVCRKFGGTLTVLFHTHQSGTRSESFYERLLERL